jgi:hypothetical protein
MADRDAPSAYGVIVPQDGDTPRPAVGENSPTTTSQTETSPISPGGDEKHFPPHDEHSHDSDDSGENRKSNRRCANLLPVWRLLSYTPKNCRYDPEIPLKLGTWLNVLYAFVLHPQFSPQKLCKNTDSFRLGRSPSRTSTITSLSSTRSPRRSTSASSAPPPLQR